MKHSGWRHWLKVEHEIMDRNQTRLAQIHVRKFNGGPAGVWVRTPTGSMPY